MKGVVVEIRNHTAAVLSEDGCVVKVNNNNYQIGQEVVCMKKIFETKKMLAFASAASALFMVSGISAYAYLSPYSYVSLDVNPSIEYSINRFDRVLSVTGVNDDGTQIIKEINLENLKNKTIKDAISLTVETLSNEGYFDSGEGNIVIATSSKSKNNELKLVKDLELAAAVGLEEDQDDIEITVEAVGATRVEEARALGVTPGKLNLVEKLIESANGSEDIVLSEWLSKPVKEIMTQTNRYRELNREMNKTRLKNSISDNTVSGNSVSGNSVSGNSVSKNSVPRNLHGNSVSKNSAPGNSVSKNSAPGNSVSQNSAPGNEAPKNSTTDNSAPKNLVPDTSAARNSTTDSSVSDNAITNNGKSSNETNSNKNNIKDVNSNNNKK